MNMIDFSPANIYLAFPGTNPKNPMKILYIYPLNSTLCKYE